MSPQDVQNAENWINRPLNSIPQVLADYLALKYPSKFKGVRLQTASKRDLSKPKGPHFEYIKNCASGDCWIAALCVHYRLDLTLYPSFIEDQLELADKNGKLKVNPFFAVFHNVVLIYFFFHYL